MEGITLLIERFKVQNKYESYIEAICDFAEEKGIDVEDVIESVSPILKEKVKTEFIKRNYFPDNKIETDVSDFINS